MRTASSLACRNQTAAAGPSSSLRHSRGSRGTSCWATCARSTQRSWSGCWAAPRWGPAARGGRTRSPTQRNTSSRWRQHATRQGGRRAHSAAADGGSDDEGGDGADRDGEYDPWGLLLLDGVNAFGELDRQTLVNLVGSRCPALYPYVRLCYGARNRVHVGDAIVEATRGVLQGDSLAPILHAIVLRHVWERVRAAVSVPRSVDGALDAFFADDGTLFGRCSVLRRLYAGLKAEGPAHGILVRDDKLQLVVPRAGPSTGGEADVGAHGAWCRGLGGRVSEHGATIMGGPVGDAEYVAAFTEAKMGRLRAQYGAVAQLEHPLMEVCMTRAVMTYKINHIVRQHPRGRLTELARPCSRRPCSALCAYRKPHRGAGQHVPSAVCRCARRAA